MKPKFQRSVIALILIVLGLLSAWGGTLYAINHPEQVKLIGLVVVLIGYAAFFGVAYLYEKL